MSNISNVDDNVIILRSNKLKKGTLIPGKLIMKKDDLYIEFTEKVKSITPGQFAAWYLKNELIGSAPIFE